MKIVIILSTERFRTVLLRDNYREKKKSCFQVTYKQRESIFHSSHSDDRTPVNVLNCNKDGVNGHWENCEPLEQIAWEDCGISIFRVACKAKINCV